MAIPFTPDDVASGFNLSKLNSNFDKVETALSDALSRSGNGPNQMEADIDLNSNDLLNVGIVDAGSLVLNGAIVTPDALQTIPPAVMSKSVYDPTGIEADVFALANHTGTISQTQLAAGIINDSKLDTNSSVFNRINELISPFDPTYNAVGGVADDRIAIQAAWDAGSTGKKTVFMSQTMNAGGELTVESDLSLLWNTGAWLKPTGKSTTGSFISNLDPSSSSVNSIVRNITFLNPQIDGAGLLTPFQLEVVSSTATTVTFTSAASDVDDFYNGLLVEDMQGNNIGGLRFVTDYVGATRTATVGTAWTINPVAGNIIFVGWNDNIMGCAAGGYDINILGGYLKNVSGSIQVPSGTGGKGINGEQGVTNMSVSGTTFYDIYNPLFCQGLDGTFANGEKKRGLVRWSNIYAKNGGSLMTIAGINTSTDPDGDSDDQMVIASNVMYENFGHSPFRIVGSDRQKSGVINFAEAQNVSISNIRGRNDATYPDTSPGYPVDFAARCGFGLSGSIGAMIWGWGRNLKVNNYVHHGNVDNVVVIRRCRAIGEDAGATGAPQNCFNWNFRGIEHHGVINEYIVRIDPTVAFRVASNELTGEMEISVNGSFVTLGLVDPNMSAFTAVTLTLKDHVGQKTVIGTPAQIIAAGNTFASFPSGITDLRIHTLRNTQLRGQTFTLADDTAMSIVPTHQSGMFLLTSDSSLLRVFVGYRADGGAQCVAVGTEPASFTADNTEGTLTGTTGVDTEFTVRCSDANNAIYFENRRGASITFTVTFLG